MKTFVLFGLFIVLLAGFSIADDEEPEYDGKYIEEYPSLVQMEVGYNNFWLLGCMGNILTSLHILSAARCFSGPLYTPIMRRARAGATFRGRDGLVIAVDSAANHPSFGTQGFEGDLTVVRLRTPLSLGDNISPVAIIRQGTAIPGNLPVEHAGWGSTAQQRLIANKGLYDINLFTINRDNCIAMYENLLFLEVTITENMICAGLSPTTGRNADLRDAGGPLYYQNVIVGVLSFGHYLGNDSFPVVATNVASFSDWIVDTAV